jgi:Hypothetical protein FLILHELTA
MHYYSYFLYIYCNRHNRHGCGVAPIPINFSPEPTHIPICPHKMNLLSFRKTPLRIHIRRNFPRNTVLPCVTHLSTKIPIEPTPTSSSPNVDRISKSPQRFEKVLNRTPKFLRNLLQPIANKPISHITSFLILHEVLHFTKLIPDHGYRPITWFNIYFP